MQLEWIYSFLETVKTKSISKASEGMNLTQPALSKHIGNLEEELDISLFHRTAQGVKLTDAGNIALPHLQEIIHKWEQLHREVIAYKENQQLILGALPSLALNYLPEKIAALSNKNLTVKVVVDHSPVLFDKVITGCLDAALLELQEDHPRLYKQTLFSEPLLIGLSPHHSLSPKKELCFQDIQDEKWAVTPNGCDIRIFLDTLFSKYQKEPIIVLETEYFENILGWVASGNCITILPSTQINFISPSTIAVLPLTEKIAHREISLIAKSEWIGKRLRNWLSGKNLS